MKGNEAIAEAAIRAGCLHFFGYPITPQSEIPEYLSRRLPELGGCYVQSESEVATSHMIYGAAGVGTKVMTSSSSPGISLMAEGISYLAVAELPVVIVNIMRAGPGLGGSLPAQSDYAQTTRGMAHGDCRLIAVSPASVQEAVDLTILAFDLAEKYRTPVILAGDGVIGQMMEPVVLPEATVGPPLKAADWALTGCVGRKPRKVSSMFLDPDELNAHNFKLKARFAEIARNETRFEAYACDEPLDLLVTSFGISARICRSAVDAARSEGLKVGLFRPITISPFPMDALREIIGRSQRVLDVEMNTGQMLHDVEMAAQGRCPIDFFGRCGGLIPSAEGILEQIRASLAQLPKGGVP